MLKKHISFGESRGSILHEKYKVISYSPLEKRAKVIQVIIHFLKSSDLSLDSLLNCEAKLLSTGRAKTTFQQTFTESDFLFHSHFLQFAELRNESRGEIECTETRKKAKPKSLEGNPDTLPFTRSLTIVFPFFPVNSGFTQCAFPTLPLYSIIHSSSLFSCPPPFLSLLHLLSAIHLTEFHLRISIYIFAR